MRTLAISTVSFVASTRMAVLIFSSSIRVTNWQWWTAVVDDWPFNVRFRCQTNAVSGQLWLLLGYIIMSMSNKGVLSEGVTAYSNYTKRWANRVMRRGLLQRCQWVNVYLITAKTRSRLVLFGRYRIWRQHEASVCREEPELLAIVHENNRRLPRRRNVEGLLQRSVNRFLDNLFRATWRLRRTSTMAKHNTTYSEHQSPPFYLYTVSFCTANELDLSRAAFHKLLLLMAYAAGQMYGDRL